MVFGLTAAARFDCWQEVSPSQNAMHKCSRLTSSFLVHYARDLKKNVQTKGVNYVNESLTKITYS